MLSGSDGEEGDDEDGLARHVWDQYTNSRTDLTKAREKLNTRVSLLEMTSAPDNLATAPKVEVTGESKAADKKPLGGKVDVPVVPEDQKSKVLQLRKKPSMDLTVTAGKDSESGGFPLTRLFGSKVKFTSVRLNCSNPPHWALCRSTLSWCSCWCSSASSSTSSSSS